MAIEVFISDENKNEDSGRDHAHIDRDGLLNCFSGQVTWFDQGAKEIKIETPLIRIVEDLILCGERLPVDGSFEIFDFYGTFDLEFQLNESFVNVEEKYCNVKIVEPFPDFISGIKDLCFAVFEQIVRVYPLLASNQIFQDIRNSCEERAGALA